MIVKYLCLHKVLQLLYFKVHILGGFLEGGVLVIQVLLYITVLYKDIDLCIIILYIILFTKCS